MIIQTILDLIESHPLVASEWGLRIDEDTSYEVGDYLPDSREWTHRDGPTETTLDGICTVGIRADAASIERALRLLRTSYSGTQLVLVGGDRASYGTDEGELIIAGRARAYGVWTW